MIVQAFVAGVEYTANLAVDEIGRSTLVVLEKLALRNGRTGNASILVAAHAPDVATTAVNAARTLQLAGPLDIDVRVIRMEDPWFSRSMRASALTSALQQRCLVASLSKR